MTAREPRSRVVNERAKLCTEYNPKLDFGETGGKRTRTVNLMLAKHAFYL